MVQHTKINLATLNWEDRWAEVDRRASENAKAAFERLKALGIIDANGDTISKEIPDDVRPGSDSDFGG